MRQINYFIQIYLIIFIYLFIFLKRYKAQHNLDN